MTTVHVLTQEFNDYDQHGAYFVAVFGSAPSATQLTTYGVPTNRLRHVMNGGGRIGAEDEWFNLGEFEITAPTGPAPIDMVLHCPACGMQHVDKPEGQFYPGHTAEESEFVNKNFGLWDNPPHRSHFCHGCGHIWRPADVPTNGVQAIKTKGKADSPATKTVTVPLTDEQIIAVRKSTKPALEDWGDTKAFARAVVAEFCRINGITHADAADGCGCYRATAMCAVNPNCRVKLATTVGWEGG